MVLENSCRVLFCQLGNGTIRTDDNDVPINVVYVIV